MAASIAATHGYTLAFRAGAVLLAVGGLLVFAALEHVDITSPEETTPRPVAAPDVAG